ncbi:uncharacterized protein LOC124124494 isoform X1 [Haliotis rufescens]|uniref:uncharacterized protein LOC124124494 isoform X1 n=1 Tax=Haliotis rufescens TaxID=6454 RepID=UPI00201EA32A|nr:uncharacterized protein LOC124124494 isoform X1 [Haliotis rufescens]XP_048251051.1 uncharacterized protein LOC124124494 isoform X1 [Haliotis rufescens]
MGLSGELPISCYLPLIVAVVCCTSNGVQSTHCPRPVTPIVVTKLTQRNLMMDPASYTQLSMSLPVKCVSEAFVPLDDEGAKCENGQWVLPNTKCVRTWLYRQTYTHYCLTPNTTCVRTWLYRLHTHTTVSIQYDVCPYVALLADIHTLLSQSNTTCVRTWLYKQTHTNYCLTPNTTCVRTWLYRQTHTNYCLTPNTTCVRTWLYKQTYTHYCLTPNTTCVPLIYRERKVTNTIMTICAAVGGVLAATFIIVKVICYRRSRGKGQRKSRKADDNMEMTSNGGVPTVSRGVTLGIDRRSAHYDEPSALSGRSSRAYSHHTQPNHNQDVRASQYSNGGGFRPDVGGHRPGSHVISAF